MLQPSNLFVILEKRWGLFTILAGIIYLYHLLWTITAVDKFTDITREYKCGDATDADTASAIFDTAIALCAIFHMIEWIRQTVFLTSALVGVNIVPVYYALSVNVPFGFIAMLTAIFTRYSENGNACAEVGLQAERANFLTLQIICLILYIPMSFAPILFLYVKGYGWTKE